MGLIGFRYAPVISYKDQSPQPPTRPPACDHWVQQVDLGFNSRSKPVLQPRICLSKKLLKKPSESPSILGCGTPLVGNSLGLSRAPALLGTCLKLSPPFVFFLCKCLHQLVGLVLWCCWRPELLDSKSLAHCWTFTAAWLCSIR